MGEINLSILKNFDTNYEIPIHITVDDIKHKYFKDKHEYKHKKIHNEPKVGIINLIITRSFSDFLAEIKGSLSAKD